MQEENTHYVAPPAPAKHRILGWCRRRIRKNPGQIWHRFNTGEFHEFTGIPIRTIRRGLRELREHSGAELTWRVLFDRSVGEKGAWVIIYASTSNLIHDCEPLFWDRKGLPRHVRAHQSGEVIAPPERRKKPVNNSDSESISEPEEGATPIEKRDTSYLSRRYTLPLRGGSVDISPAGRKRLEAKAYAIARRLAWKHWDNCKVEWEIHPIRAIVYEFMRSGWSEERITTVYDRILHECHMLATDIGHNEGKPAEVFFNPAPVLVRMRKSLKRWRAKNVTVTSFHQNPNVTPTISPEP